MRGNIRLRVNQHSKTALKETLNYIPGKVTLLIHKICLNIIVKNTKSRSGK